MQQITFVKENQPLKTSRDARGGGAVQRVSAARPSAIAAAGHRATGVNEAQDSARFSKIVVHKHLLQPNAAGPMRPVAYHYRVCGPHMKGFQRYYSQFTPMNPTQIPWNQLDHIVCGWDRLEESNAFGLRLRCKRFALLNLEEKREDSLRRLLSAPPGTQRLLGAAMARRDEGPGSAQELEEGAGGSLERDADAHVLTRKRFEAFIEAVAPRVPLRDQVTWATSGSHPRPSSLLLDMTDDSGVEAGAQHGRRMFVQVLFDVNACAEQAWHIELRWNMCQGQRVEELAKYVTRRAMQSRLLLLQIPTGRRPRPFSPPVRIPLADDYHEQALRALRTQLCFVRESLVNGSPRWMHELGTAFVQVDSADSDAGKGFLWSANLLLPSQAARAHSERLLNAFREICEQLELDSSPNLSRASSAASNLSSASQLHAPPGGRPQLTRNLSVGAMPVGTGLGGGMPMPAAPQPVAQPQPQAAPHPQGQAQAAPALRPTNEPESGTGGSRNQLQFDTQ